MDSEVLIGLLNTLKDYLHIDFKIIVSVAFIEYTITLVDDYKVDDDFLWIYNGNTAKIPVNEITRISLEVE